MCIMSQSIGSKTVETGVINWVKALTAFGSFPKRTYNHVLYEIDYIVMLSKKLELLFYFHHGSTI